MYLNINVSYYIAIGDPDARHQSEHQNERKWQRLCAFGSYHLGLGRTKRNQPKRNNLLVGSPGL